MVIWLEGCRATFQRMLGEKQDLAHAAARREDAKSIAQPDELIDFHHLKARAHQPAATGARAGFAFRIVPVTWDRSPSWTSSAINRRARLGLCGYEVGRWLGLFGDALCELARVSTADGARLPYGTAGSTDTP